MRITTERESRRRRVGGPATLVGTVWPGAVRLDRDRDGSALPSAATARLDRDPMREQCTAPISRKTRFREDQRSREGPDILYIGGDLHRKVSNVVPLDEAGNVDLRRGVVNDSIRSTRCLVSLSRTRSRSH
jgi:hypothetical protein